MRYSLSRLVVQVMGLAAAGILVFMMLFTAYAVSSRQFFDAPVLGVVDVMELALVSFVFVAMPAVFLRDENVTVDVIDSLVSASVVRLLRYFAWFVALGFLGVSLYAMIPAAAEKFTSYEVTMTLSIHKFIHWIPILFGFVASILATLWVLTKGPVLDENGADASDSTTDEPVS